MGIPDPTFLIQKYIIVWVVLYYNLNFSWFGYMKLPFGFDFFLTRLLKGRGVPDSIFCSINLLVEVQLDYITNQSLIAALELLGKFVWGG